LKGDKNRRQDVCRLKGGFTAFRASAQPSLFGSSSPLELLEGSIAK
jgi:hypothetical protein